jgi:DNA repair photolyase
MFVRWDHLTITEDEAKRLPGHRDPAIIRRFDAPEALDMRFYEVRARSALNRVPKASQMPFRWTINPYRGCSHACVYCLGGNTPILMGDGSHKPLAKLRVGDEIFGTEGEGVYRRYVRTRVRAHWTTTKPAFRVVLRDGTELTASADHRLLTQDGWLHVAGPRRGRDRRPQLTIGTVLLGTGRFAAGPQRGDDYARGYLRGVVRGDGTTAHSWLAPLDDEALDRAERYLSGRGVYTTLSPTRPGAERTRALRAQVGSRGEPVRELFAWPQTPSDEWRKGFLAGVFDADGSCAAVIRIGAVEAGIVRWIESSLVAFEFETVLESAPFANGASIVRVRGGLRERLRFFHLVDPALRRRLDLEGSALASDTRTEVVAVEPLEMASRLYDITTGTGDFIANGIVSHNCFARPSHTYLDFDAGRDFEREIVVKVNAPEVVRAELARPSWKGEHVAMGTNTDPYQWVESRYELMPGIWEAMRDARNPCSILTKSPLLLRDLDLMREIAAVTDIHANLSIPTLDRKAWRASEPHTPNPKARLEAVAELNRAGIPTGVLVAPLMPGINDAPEQVEPLLEAAAEAGATGIGGIALHLRGEVRKLYLDWLRSYRPDLVEAYERLYARGAYAPAEERRRLAELVRSEQTTWPQRFASREREPQPQSAAEPQPGAQQSLF